MDELTAYSCWFGLFSHQIKNLRGPNTSLKATDVQTYGLPAGNHPDLPEFVNMNSTRTTKQERIIRFLGSDKTNEARVLLSLILSKKVRFQCALSYIWQYDSLLPFQAPTWKALRAHFPILKVLTGKAKTGS